MHNETEKTVLMFNWLNSQPDNTLFMSGLKFIVAILNLCNLKHEKQLQICYDRFLSNPYFSPFIAIFA
jgi:hypothetical protein